MNCDLAIELLPWLLNGTLDDAERQQVREHLATCQPCRNAWQETAAAAALFDWHPAAADLVAAASGEAVPPLLAEHIASCPQCAADVELARTGRLLLESGAAGDGAIASATAARDGASVTLLRPAPARKADEIRGGAGESHAGASARDDRATARTWQRAALAAGLAGLLALGGWLASARHGQVLEAKLAQATAQAAGSTTIGESAASQPATNGMAGAANSGSGNVGAEAAGTSQAAELSREAVAARARLDELARQNQALQARVAELGRLASATAARAAAATGTSGGAGAAGAATMAGAGAATRSGGSGADYGAPAIESSVWTDELTANGQAVRGAEAAAPAAIPLSAGAATLLLRSRHAAGTAMTAAADGDGAFEVEIHDAQDRRVGTAVPVARRRDSSDATAEFDVILRRGALAPGSYTLQLFGRSPAGRKLVDSYSLRVS